MNDRLSDLHGGGYTVRRAYPPPRLKQSQDPWGLVRHHNGGLEGYYVLDSRRDRASLLIHTHDSHSIY